jgi:hypothetical protein
MIAADPRTLDDQPPESLKARLAQQDRRLRWLFRAVLVAVLVSTVGGLLLPVQERADGSALLDGAGLVLVVLPVAIQNEVTPGAAARITFERGRMRHVISGSVVAVEGPRRSAAVPAALGGAARRLGPAILVARVRLHEPTNFAEGTIGTAEIDLRSTRLGELVSPDLAPGRAS